MELKDTLNLPETEFPMRAGLVEREPLQIEAWEDMDLYGQIQRKNKNKKKYILHDGPPFTNGDVHIGTGLNKILKDIVVKIKSMQGYSTPYVPGWDCHGLPIEYKVMKQLQKEKKQLSSLEIRQACANFSNDFIKKQKKQFKRLGLLADWDREYRTMDPSYEAEIIRVFAQFVEKGLVYRSKKPVYWSIPCKTALAEMEIEYQDHTSPSIYVKFKVDCEEKFGLKGPIYFVIWTTTPWTLPGNLGIAVHAELEYEFLKFEGETYIIAKDLKESFIKSCSLSTPEVVNVVKGFELELLKAQHPFIDRESLVVNADYVTTENGTGCVHTAPGHGPDDYLTGMKYGLDIYCPVNDHGKYDADGQVPSELVGLSVLERESKCPANEGVLELLKKNNALVHLSKCRHSYPYCWRSKTPVIYRALDQWFVNLDSKGTREDVIDAIQRVQWIPDWSEARIRGAITGRPDWCISRQRSWGVPIPVFYDNEGTALLDGDVIKQIAKKIETEGTDFWFREDASVLLEGIKLPEVFQGKTLKKGEDTMDVWLDSGTSHLAVLKSREGLSWPADLYLEGSDQHRGWFQSSLWTSVICEAQAPYKEVITHGFVVNEDKKKISKSDKNPQTVDAYVAKFGADVLRLWVSSEDYRTDVPISEGILKQIVQTYRTLRNTFRFQLGNLYDFDNEKDRVDYDDLTVLDKWVLHKLEELISEVTSAYAGMEFHRGYQFINRFCTVTLSAIYHDILKDRLYTYGPKWKERRAAQTVIREVFLVLVKLLAPVLVFTTEEAYSYFSENKEKKSIHLEDWPVAEESWKNEELSQDMEILFTVRDRVNEGLEQARKRKELGQSLDAKITLEVPENNVSFKLLKGYEAFLPELFIVSDPVEIKATSKSEIVVIVTHAEGERCPRSWRWVSELVEAEGFGLVSKRDKEALLDKYPN